MAPWSKHLCENEICPKMDPNKVTLFNMRFCPYAQRAVLVLNALKIPYDCVNINLKSKPKWFLEKNPLGKVPTIQIGEDVLYESLPVCEYLDAAYSNINNASIMPQTPMEKAKDKMILARFDASIGCFYKIFRMDTTSDEEKKMEALTNFQNSLLFLEQELKNRGTKFFHSKTQPGMLDYMIWPWIERVETIPKFHPKLPEIIPGDQFPNFNVWIQNMLTDSAVKEYFLDSETHYTYSLSSREGKNNYDLL